MTHAELRRLAEAATPGPWYVEKRPHTYWEMRTKYGSLIFRDANECDAAYIAAVNPKTVLGLLDEIERLRLREDLAAMRAAMGFSVAYAERSNDQP